MFGCKLRWYQHHQVRPGSQISQRSSLQEQRFFRVFRILVLFLIFLSLPSLFAALHPANTTTTLVTTIELTLHLLGARFPLCEVASHLHLSQIHRMWSHAPLLQTLLCQCSLLVISDSVLHSLLLFINIELSCQPAWLVVVKAKKPVQCSGPLVLWF